MDYREVENRLARNREMLKEREHYRMTQAILDADKPQRISLWMRLAAWLGGSKSRKAEPQPCLPINAQTRLERR